MSNAFGNVQTGSAVVDAIDRALNSLRRDNLDRDIECIIVSYEIYALLVEKMARGRPYLEMISVGGVQTISLMGYPLYRTEAPGRIIICSKWQEVLFTITAEQATLLSPRNRMPTFSPPNPNPTSISFDRLPNLPSVPSVVFMPSSSDLDLIKQIEKESQVKNPKTPKAKRTRKIKLD